MPEQPAPNRTATLVAALVCALLAATDLEAMRLTAGAVRFGLLLQLLVFGVLAIVEFVAFVRAPRGVN